MQTEKVVNHIVNWLKDYATNANMKGFTIGISGGIDSAVTSTWAFTFMSPSITNKAVL